MSLDCRELLPNTFANNSTMKINPVSLLLALAFAALFTYLNSVLYSGDSLQTLIIGSGIPSAISWVLALAVSHENGRHSVNLRLVAMLFVGLVIAVNLLFATIGFTTPLFVIANSLITLIFAVVYQSIYKRES